MLSAQSLLVGLFTFDLDHAWCHIFSVSLSHFQIWQSIACSLAGNVLLYHFIIYKTMTPYWNHTVCIHSKPGLVQFNASACNALQCQIVIWRIVVFSKYSMEMYIYDGRKMCWGIVNDMMNAHSIDLCIILCILIRSHMAHYDADSASYHLNNDVPIYFDCGMYLWQQSITEEMVHLHTFTSSSFHIFLTFHEYSWCSAHSSKHYNVC